MSVENSIIYSGLLIKSRYENALDSLLKDTALPKDFVDHHLSAEQRLLWNGAQSRLNKAAYEQRELCRAPKASREYGSRCSAVAYNLQRIHQSYRKVRYAIGLDPSKRRVELKRIRLEHREHEEAFRSVFRDKRKLSQEELAAFTYRDHGKYRWVPNIEWFDPASTWPVEVKYAEHIELLTKWIAELDEAINGLKTSVSE